MKRCARAAGRINRALARFYLVSPVSETLFDRLPGKKNDDCNRKPDCVDHCVESIGSGKNFSLRFCSLKYNDSFGSSRLPSA